MKIKKYSLKIENYLIIMFTLAYCIANFLQISSQIGNLLIAFVGIISFIYIIIRKDINNPLISHMICYVIILSFCMLCSIIYNGNARITNILWIFTYAGIALILWIYPVSSKFLFNIFYVIAIFFLLCALLGRNPQQIFSHSSGNNISTAMMYFMLIAYREVKSRLLPLIPAVIFAIISFWGNGRAGILTSILFLSLVFLYNFFSIKSGKLWTLFFTVCIIITSMYVIKYFLKDAVIQYQYKIQHYGLKSVRTEIWSEYLKGIFASWGNFLFGLSTNSELYHKLSYYNGNTHNAFLMLHSKFGILGFIFFIYKIIKAIIKTLKKHDYIFLIIIFSVIFRSFFDWTAFPGILDVYFWLMVLYVENNKRI